MSAGLFGDCAFNPGLVHQAVVAWLAGGRQGSAAQKSRGQVRGGGRKPWQQKRLGRARAGSIRSPIWRGGGVTFAATPRDHSQRLNRRMFRAALRSLLAEQDRQGCISSLQAIPFAEPRTRLMVDFLRQNELEGQVLLITADRPEQHLELAARNLPAVQVLGVRKLNPVALLRADRVVLIDPARQRIEEWLK